jgi:hypothetical protein
MKVVCRTSPNLVFFLVVCLLSTGLAVNARSTSLRSITWECYAHPSKTNLEAGMQLCVPLAASIGAALATQEDIVVREGSYTENQATVSGIVSIEYASLHIRTYARTHHRTRTSCC